MRISDWSSDVCSSDLIIFLLMTGYGFNARAEPATPSRVGSFTLPAADRNMLFGDPFILHEEGVYYMYGTSADDGIEVFRSADLLNLEGPVGARDGLALHKYGVWGVRWFWAP